MTGGDSIEYVSRCTARRGRNVLYPFRRSEDNDERRSAAVWPLASDALPIFR